LINLYNLIDIKCYWEFNVENLNNDYITETNYTRASYVKDLKMFICNIPELKEFKNNSKQKIFLFLIINKIAVSKKIDLLLYPNTVINDVFPKTSKNIIIS